MTSATLGMPGRLIPLYFLALLLVVVSPANAKEKRIGQFFSMGNTVNVVYDLDSKQILMSFHDSHGLNCVVATPSYRELKALQAAYLKAKKELDLLSPDEQDSISAPGLPITFEIGTSIVHDKAVQMVARDDYDYVYVDIILAGDLWEPNYQKWESLLDTMIQYAAKSRSSNRTTKKVILPATNYPKARK